MTDLRTLSLIPPKYEHHEAIAMLELDRHERNQRSVGRPDGLRLSISCPVRRIKAGFDSWFHTPIDEGVGWRGHLLESYALAVLLDQHEYAAQSVIEWSHGLSAFDARILAAPDGSPLTGIIDWKSTASGRKPTSENKAQAEIMMVAAGMEPGAVVNHWQLHISNWTAVGPYPHTLTDDAYRQRLDELAGTATAFDYLNDLMSTGSEPTKADEWDDPKWWAYHHLICDCGGCIPYIKADAGNAIERIWYRWELAHDTQSEGKRLQDAMRDKLIAAAELQPAARDTETGKKVVINVYGGGEGTITRSPAGKWTIRRKNTTNEQRTREL